MAAIDVVNRVLREFRRYTGDGLPGEPVNAPLPVGDPQSGVHSPKKAELRTALLSTIDGGGEAAQAVIDANLPAILEARDDAEASASAAWDSAHAASASATKAGIDADRAEGYAAAAGAASGLLSRKTVALLIADTVFSYTAGEGKTLVAPGDIITAQGFRYEVAPSGATDAHVETAGGVKLYVLPSDTVTIEAFGAIFSGDESAIAQKMLDALDVLRVPAGRILTCKNVELSAGQKVDARGILKLPDGCVDYDRLLYASGQDDLDIYLKEIDGNFDGQSGNIGTHLVYLVECDRLRLRVDNLHDHYIASGFTMPDVDGDGRNQSTGAIWLHQCEDAIEVKIGLADGWSREGIYLQDCMHCLVQDAGTWRAHPNRNTEYSGLQASGSGNKVSRVSVDGAGASGVGFDTINGILSTALVTNTRENHGVNFGHPGRPASGSVATNIIVDGAWVGGIRVGSSTEGLTISNFTVSDAERGVQVSDGATDIRCIGGSIERSGRWNWVVGGPTAVVTAASVKGDVLDGRVVQLESVSGNFEEGETVTCATGSGVVRRVLKNLTGVKQRLYLESFTGTFSGPAVAVTGATSGATGIVEYDATPVRVLEQDGGKLVDDSRVVTSGTHRYVPHLDGTADFWASISINGVADTDVSNVLNFVSTMTWAEAPYVQATLASNSSTASFTVTKLQASATTSAITTILRTSAAQTYGVALEARGRWKS